MTVIRYDLIFDTFLVSLFDWIFIPIYLVALLNPYHWKPIICHFIFSKETSDVDYKETQSMVEKEE